MRGGKYKWWGIFMFSCFCLSHIEGNLAILITPCYHNWKLGFLLQLRTLQFNSITCAAQHIIQFIKLVLTYFLFVLTTSLILRKAWDRNNRFNKHNSNYMVKFTTNIQFLEIMTFISVRLSSELECTIPQWAREFKIK